MLFVLCAGCLPSIATIPIFIGLYRSLMAASNEGLFEEGEHWHCAAAAAVPAVSLALLYTPWYAKMP